MALNPSVVEGEPSSLTINITIDSASPCDPQYARFELVRNNPTVGDPYATTASGVVWTHSDVQSDAGAFSLTVTGNTGLYELHRLFIVAPSCFFIRVIFYDMIGEYTMDSYQPLIIFLSSIYEDAVIEDDSWTVDYTICIRESYQILTTNHIKDRFRGLDGLPIVLSSKNKVKDDSKGLTYKEVFSDSLIWDIYNNSTTTWEGSGYTANRLMPGTALRWPKTFSAYAQIDYYESEAYAYKGEKMTNVSGGTVTVYIDREKRWYASGDTPLVQTVSPGAYIGFYAKPISGYTISEPFQELSYIQGNTTLKFAAIKLPEETITVELLLYNAGSENSKPYIPLNIYSRKDLNPVKKLGSISVELPSTGQTGYTVSTFTFNKKLNTGAFWSTLSATYSNNNISLTNHYLIPPYYLYLKSYNTVKKNEIIKVVKTIGNWTLPQAKKLVDAAPSIIAYPPNDSIANTWKNQILGIDSSASVSIFPNSSQVTGGTATAITYSLYAIFKSTGGTSTGIVYYITINNKGMYEDTSEEYSFDWKVSYCTSKNGKSMATMPLPEDIMFTVSKWGASKTESEDYGEESSFTLKANLLNSTFSVGKFVKEGDSIKYKYFIGNPPIRIDTTNSNFNCTTEQATFDVGDNSYVLYFN